MEARALLAVVPLITDASIARVLVPTQADYDNLGFDWTGSAEPFDDSTWIATPEGGPGGVGFEAEGPASYAPWIGLDVAAAMQPDAANARQSAFVRIPFTVTDLSELDGLTLSARFDDGFVAWINGTLVHQENLSPAQPYLQDLASEHDALPPATFDLSEHLGVLVEGQNILAVRAANSSPMDEDFLFQAELFGVAPNPVPIAVDDAFSIPQDSAATEFDVLANDLPSEYALDPTSVRIEQQPAHGTASVNPATGRITYTPLAGYVGSDTLTYTVYDTDPSVSSGNETTLRQLIAPNAAHRTFVPPSGDLGLTWTAPSFDDTAWQDGAGGIGYDRETGFVDYSPLISDNTESRIYQLAPTLYERIPFTVGDPANVLGMRLLIQYDDAFVAYINGTRVAATPNAPDPAGFDSFANSSRDGGDQASLNADTFTIDLTGVTLNPGPNGNVLAIHAMNVSLDSSDMLLRAELVADVRRVGQVTEPATVTIDVTSLAPTANDDTVAGFANQPVDIPVLANDATGAAGLPLRPESVAVTAAPAHGTVSVSPLGVVTYTPAPGFSGEDSFRYTVRDTATVGGAENVLLLPRGAQWRYLGAPDQGAAWIAEDFNDASWPQGPAEIGFGDGGEATVIPNGGRGTHTTLYFRAKFAVASAAAVSEMRLRVRYDDGFAAYINGQEVERQNLAPGAAYGDYSQGFIFDDGTNYNEYVLTRAAGDLAFLKDGVNTIAIEVHQSDSNSTDMSFDAEVEVAQLLPTGRVSNEATVTVSVESSDEPPIARDDSVSTRHDLPVDINVLTNDQPRGAVLDPASIAIVQPPSHGTVTVGAAGVVRYAPHSGYVGDDAFSYTVLDADARLSNVASASITVTNAIPAALGDHYWVDEDDTLNLSVASLTANDSDDSDVLTVSLVAMPANGSVVLAESGMYRYTPAPDFSGADQFTYRITDELGASSDAVVTIDVNPARDAPVGVDDRYLAAAGVPLTVGEAEPPRLPLVAAGSSWRYLDDGSNQGTLWRGAEYDDSAWKSGLGAFGYGNGNETTTIESGSPDQRHITTYFRKAFNFDALFNTPRLLLGLLRDDGASVYLNGVEVVRDNLPLRVNYDTPAVRQATAGEESSYLPFIIDRQWLTHGENVLAVEVHQYSQLSNDMAFDLRLTGLQPNAAAQGVLANELDADGDYLVASLVAPPAHGSVELDLNGRFTYTPDDGFVGTDRFFYRAFDGYEYTAPVTVEIVVSASSAPADIDGSGVVDLADLVRLLPRLGSSASQPQGDADGDGSVGLTDVLAVRQAMTPPGAAPSAAPAALVARAVDRAVLELPPARAAARSSARRRAAPLASDAALAPAEEFSTVTAARRRRDSGEVSRR